MSRITPATRYRCLSPTDLTTELQSRWLELLTEPGSETPFLHPEYCRVLGSVNSDVELLVIEETNDVAFLPFQRVGRVAHPAGLRL